jgi:hypothetical protein
MSLFDTLQSEVAKGLRGDNYGLPLGFDKLNKHIGIRKRLYFLVGGTTGCGKTTFVDDAFVLNPIDYVRSEKGKGSPKLRIIYRSMERSRVYKLAKWTSRKIFLDTGIVIPVSKLLTWNKENKLTKDEHDLFLNCKDYLDEIEEYVTIIDGPDNPISIALQIKKHASEHGREEQIDKYNKVYIPNNDNEITIVVLDTMNLLQLTRLQATKKTAIDKMSDELRYARDFYGYTIAAVTQFNRDIANSTRMKSADVEPILEDFKESGQTQDDADAVITLFDPVRYRVRDVSGYKLKELEDKNGHSRFRSLRLLKNTYGMDNLRLGLAFRGDVGIFKELPHKNYMTDDIYSRVATGEYFLE